MEPFTIVYLNEEQTVLVEPDDKLSGKSLNVDKFSYVIIFFTLGSLIGRLGGTFYRLIFAVNIPSSDYEFYVVLVNTVTFLIPIAGFGLHIPLTRSIKIDPNNSTVLGSVIWVYRIGNLIGIGFLIILGSISYYDVPILILAILGLTLIGWSYHEYFIGVLRGLDKTKTVSFLVTMPGLIRLIGILVLYFIESINLYNVLLIYFLPFLFSLIFNLFIVPDYFKYIINFDTIKLSQIKKEFKEGLFSTISIFSNNSILWIVTIISSLWLTSQNFLIFDLTILIISIVGILSSNLTLSILQVNSKGSSSIRFSKLKLIYLLLTILFILTSMALFVLVYSSNLIFRIVDNFIEITNKELFLNILKNCIFIPISMIGSSIFRGILQSLGKLNTQAIVDFISLLISIIFILLIWDFNSVNYLPLVFVIFNTSIIIIFHISYFFGSFKVLKGIALTDVKNK